MSKSLGNVVDPVAKMDEYGVDGFRYYLLKESRLADDGGECLGVAYCGARQHYSSAVMAQYRMFTVLAIFIPQ